MDYNQQLKLVADIQSNNSQSNYKFTMDQNMEFHDILWTIGNGGPKS